MSKSSKGIIFLVGLLIAGAVFAGLAFQKVWAADATPQPGVQQDSGQQKGWDRMGPGMAKDEGVRGQALADALGISLTDLQTAVQKANQAALDKAVADGLITQAQADAMKSHEGGLPFKGHMRGWLDEQGLDYNALLAEALGITPEALLAAQNTVFEAQLAQAVTDGNLTQEQADLMKAQRNLRQDPTFQSAMQTAREDLKAAYQAALQKAVEAGILTQAQADQLLNEPVGRFGMGGMMGGGERGRGGMMGGGRGGMHGGGGFGPGAGDCPMNNDDAAAGDGL